MEDLEIFPFIKDFTEEEKKSLTLFCNLCLLKKELLYIIKVIYVVTVYYTQ